jgi:BirA family biotin operon repressor/biotin-[acetyl-CoA-carboxylase] ligase
LRGFPRPNSLPQWERESSEKFPGVSHVVYAEEIDSTQTLARVLAQDDAPAGTLVWAKRQNAGRGRLERTWSSPVGGLYFSLILKPTFPPSKLAELSLAAARSISQAVSRVAGIVTKIKPPNDVYAQQDNQWRKLAGILAEAAGSESSISWLVVGIGVNVNNHPPLRSATSLKAITNRSWKLETLLSSILAEFQDSCAAIEP